MAPREQYQCVMFLNENAFLFVWCAVVAVFVVNYFNTAYTYAQRSLLSAIVSLSRLCVHQQNVKEGGQPYLPKNN